MGHARTGDRRLVLVDIENVIGGSERTADQVAGGLRSVRTTVGERNCDVWVVGCGVHLVGVATSVLPTRVALGRGLDGADRALLGYLELDEVIGRYASVVLASGDAKAFATPIRALAAVGVPTDVVIGEGLIGADLYTAARSVTRVQSRSTILAAA